MGGDAKGRNDPRDPGDQPITPHAAPIVDVDGNLTYIGDDGRRYVVAPPPEPPRIEP